MKKPTKKENQEYINYLLKRNEINKYLKNNKSKYINHTVTTKDNIYKGTNNKLVVKSSERNTTPVELLRNKLIELGYSEFVNSVKKINKVYTLEVI
jgi:hypothetical protein